MHLLINNNLFVKKYTLFYWILRVRAGPDWSAAVRRKGTRSGPRGSVRSAFEPVPFQLYGGREGQSVDGISSVHEAVHVMFGSYTRTYTSCLDRIRIRTRHTEIRIRS